MSVAIEFIDCQSDTGKAGLARQMRWERDDHADMSLKQLVVAQDILK